MTCVQHEIVAKVSEIRAENAIQNEVQDHKVYLWHGHGVPYLSHILSQLRQESLRLLHHRGGSIE